MHTYKQDPQHWKLRYAETSPSERHADATKEAVMVHAKTIDKTLTGLYEERCKFDYKKKWQGCYVAYPWPKGKKGKETHNEDGFEYNCFINDKVEDYWVPRLRKALHERQKEISAKAVPH